MVRHGLPGRIPRHRREQLVGVAQALGRIVVDRCINGGRELGWRVGNAGQSKIAVGVNDIGNRGRHNRPAAREILGRLGRADVARGLVASERQHRDLPTGEVMR